MQIKSSNPDLETIFMRIKRGTIDLQPDFQRDLVWNKQKKQGLIDTIIRRWKFPPVFLVRSDESDALEVLDGQQRLNAILEFFQNKFPIKGDIAPTDNYVSKLDGLYYKDLPADAERIFNEYDIQLFELYEYKEDEPYELFFRLNQGSHLTPSEKRNTLFGSVRNQVRNLVSLMDDHGINIDKIGFNNSRLSYHDVISRLIFIIDGRGTIKRKITDSDLVEFFRSGVPVSNSSFDMAKKSVERLSKSINGKVKLNKSTLLTWLLYFSLEDYHPALLDAFETIRKEVKLGYDDNDYYNSLMSIYQEKSSSSVNDAVPVQLRLLVSFIIADYIGAKQSSETSRKAKMIHEKSISERRVSESDLINFMSSAEWNYG